MNTEAKYYSPAKILSIANGAIGYPEFRGLNSDMFAFTKLNIGCDDPTKLTQIKATATMLDGRKTLFANVQLEALRRLFQYRQLMGALEIDRSRSFKLALENISGATQIVGVDLSGFDAPQFEAVKANYAAKGVAYPEPEFLYATATIAAGADSQTVKINIPEAATKLYRIAISSTSDNDLQVSLKVNNVDIVPLRFVSQINNQFQSDIISLPVAINKHEVFEAKVTNLDNGSTHEISIICEAYRVD